MSYFHHNSSPHQGANYIRPAHLRQCPSLPVFSRKNSLEKLRTLWYNTPQWDYNLESILLSFALLMEYRVGTAHQSYLTRSRGIPTATSPAGSARASCSEFTVTIEFTVLYEAQHSEIPVKVIC